MAQQTLGCAQSYTTFVTPRGGGRPIGRLDNVTSVTWDRKLNAAGAATVTLGQGQVSDQCCRLLNTLAQDEAQGAYELSIYRDSAEVWCGPITTLTETVGPTTQQLQVTALDVCEYLDRHQLQAGYAISGDVVEIAAAVIGADLATDDPGIGINMVVTDAGVSASRAAARASNSILAELTALVASGLRFTTVVRALYLGGMNGVAFGTPINLSVSDIAGNVTMVHDATVYVNTVYGTSGNAAAGVTAGQVPPDDPQLIVLGGPEDRAWRGRIEASVSASAGANGTASVLAAAQSVYFGARKPRVLRVADGAQLAPGATVAVSDLICGSVVRIAGTGHFCTYVPEDLQLVRVSGTYDANGEKIGISLGPVT